MRPVLAYSPKNVQQKIHQVLLVNEAPGAKLQLWAPLHNSPQHSSPFFCLSHSSVRTICRPQSRLTALTPLPPLCLIHSLCINPFIHFLHKLCAQPVVLNPDSRPFQPFPSFLLKPQFVRTNLPASIQTHGLTIKTPFLLFSFLQTIVRTICRLLQAHGLVAIPFLKSSLHNLSSTYSLNLPSSIHTHRLFNHSLIFFPPLSCRFRSRLAAALTTISFFCSLRELCARSVILNLSS